MKMERKRAVKLKFHKRDCNRFAGSQAMLSAVVSPKWTLFYFGGDGETVSTIPRERSPSIRALRRFLHNFRDIQFSLLGSAITSEIQ